MKRKRTAFILFILILSFTAFSQKITVNLQEQTLTQALNELGSTYNLKFAFDNEITDTITVSGKFRNVGVEEMVNALLQNSPLAYKKQGDVFILFPSPGPKPDKPVSEVAKAICIIKGTVKDKNSGENLPYATVYIPGTSVGTMTNSDGFFNLITGSCDSTSVTVSYLGYNPVVYQAKPGTNPEPFTVFLNSEPEMIEEIEIRYEPEILQNSIKEDPYCTRLNLGKTANVPSISELDVVAPIQMMPGIDGTTESSAGLEIRKSAPDKNLIIYDGFNIYQIDHFFGSFSSINSKLIKDIKVYKIIPDARCGGRTAGVTEITGKSGNMYKPVVDISADMLSVDAKIELPLVKEKVSFIAAGRRSYTDFYQTPVYVSMFRDIRYDYDEYYSKIPFALNNQEDDPSLKYYDFGSKFTWKPSGKQVVSLSYYEAADDMNFKINEDYPLLSEASSTSSRGAGLRWSGEVSKRWESEVTLGYSLTKMFFDHEDSKLNTYQRQHISYTDTVDRKYLINSELDDFTGGLINRITLNATNRIETGLQVNHFTSDYYENILLENNRRSFGDTTRNYNNSSLLTTPFIQHVFNGKKLVIKSGLRAGYFSLTEKIKPEFRLSATWAVSDRLLFKGIAGNYFQYTNKIDLIDQGDYRSTWILSDGETFPVVRSFQITAGINYSVDPSFNIDVELYRKKNTGLVTIQYVYSGGNSGDLNQEFRIYNFNSMVHGADILIKKSFGKYQSWIAYTLSRSVSQADNVNDGDPFPSDDDQRHEFKLFNSLSVKNFNFTLSWIFGSGKPWDELAYTDTYRLTADYEKNSERLPAYHRMDAGMNYTLKAGKTSVKAGISLYNVYNRKNLLDKTVRLKSNPVREVINGNTAFETTDIYGLGFIPNLYLNFRF